MKSVKNAVITISLLAVFAGGLFYSFYDRKQATIQAEQKKRDAEVVNLTGLIALDVEEFFKDQRVIKVLNDNNFRVNVTRIGSREMASRISKQSAPDFFISSGVVAGNQITESAKKNGYTTATYSPFFTPMVIASWAPVAKILTSNGMATPVGSGGDKDKIYDLDMTKLVNVMLAKKRWRDLNNSQEYDVGRSILVSTTDVRKSNSAAMYLALTSYAINGSEIITSTDSAQSVALKVADLFKRQGYQESYVNGNFDDYVGIGMGKAPLAFIYENQLVNYAITRKQIDAQMVLMYPKPTIFNKLVTVTMNEKSKPFAQLLGSNPELLKIATEYGFRTGDGSALAQASAGAGLAVKQRIVDVVDPPSFEVMTIMINEVTNQMKQ